jgi:transposase
MFNSPDNKITDMQRIFLEPSNSTHRQYEALRSYFVDGLPSKEAAARFGYSPGTFRVLCHKLRQDPWRQFFLPPEKGPRRAPKKENLREKVVALRKQNLSIYDISEVLAAEKKRLSPAAVSLILKEEGFARLPRRADEERPPRAGPQKAEAADLRRLDLSPRSFRTQFGGLFLFLPSLVEMDFEKIIGSVELPGSKMIPASCAMRSLLALKLYGRRRHSHVMSYVLDEGLALIAGLNVIPKRSFLTEYSCRIDPHCYPFLMSSWFDAVTKLGLEWGLSFNLDFHTIPFHGEEALVEKHYVTKRSRRQKGILAFVAEDAEQRVFCYGNTDLRKDEQADEILRFVDFWKARTGKLPEELIFDSKLTTYTNLARLNEMGIRFITLRRRSKNMLQRMRQSPVSAWRRIELKGVTRLYRTPKILEQRVALGGYQGPIRQISIIDLGHEEPTILLTNQLSRSASTLISRYAQRMIIENSLADGIEFFHMDALSSAVAMKVNCDLQLTLMASSLYRILGARIGRGYQTAKSQHIFRDFIDATASVHIGEDEILVRFQKRAHNPLLIAAGFHQTDIRVPWLGGKRLQLIFG